MAYSGDRKREYQRAWRAARRQRGVEYLGGRCVECLSPDNLEFDHIDPSTKERFHSTTRSIVWSYSWGRILKELDKCQLLCDSCHRKKTSKQFSLYIHGTITMYENHKCRCDQCKVAKRRVNAKRR